LPAEPRPGRRLADRAARALAEAPEAVGEADRRRRLALARRRRRHGGHEHERAVRPAAHALDRVPANLRLVAAVRLEGGAVQSERLADRLGRLGAHGTGDVDVLFSHHEVLMSAAPAGSWSPERETPDESGAW